ncbi:cytochrome bd-I oxidase subunit CydX [Trinickia mobilis]|nr:cytochrome bd-I oxidase subunit CydX [Trinickia mobilis]
MRRQRAGHQIREAWIMWYFSWILGIGVALAFGVNIFVIA